MSGVALPDWLDFRPRIFPSCNFAWLAGPRPILVDTGFRSDLDATLGTDDHHHRPRGKSIRQRASRFSRSPPRMSAIKHTASGRGSYVSGPLLSQLEPRSMEE
jgi:hypothetical protein